MNSVYFHALYFSVITEPIYSSLDNILSIAFTSTTDWCTTDRITDRPALTIDTDCYCRIDLHGSLKWLKLLAQLKHGPNH